MSKVGVVVGAIVALAGSWLAWQWGFCRFYVAPGAMAIINAKSGEALAPGQILAKPGQQGIQEQVLGEGRHFLNPWLYEHKIVPVVTIPPGKVGVVTSKIGVELPPGEFLAEPGQKGIWRRSAGSRQASPESLWLSDRHCGRDQHSGGLRRRSDQLVREANHARRLRRVRAKRVCGRISCNRGCTT
jgi:hypothetical protein